MDFTCLTATFDWYSRHIITWDLDDTLAATSTLTTDKKAFEIAKPEILNSNQGCQFTSNKYTHYLKEHEVKISIDSEKRWANNIMIEK